VCIEGAMPGARLSCGGPGLRSNHGKCPIGPSSRVHVEREEIHVLLLTTTTIDFIFIL
jgi:hypothetical protein